jgi:thiol:disulfide interchange protein DsbD
MSLVGGLVVGALWGDARTGQAQTRRANPGAAEPVWDLSKGAGARTVTNARGTIELIASGPSTGAMAQGTAQGKGAAELWIALRFQLTPGWHIYWRNPGDSGGPPIVKWSLPPGATISEFEWPAPHRIPLGPLVNFGYEESVVLPAKITLPAGQAASPLQIGGFVRWLICKDVCVSDEATLSMNLPLAAQDKALAAQWAGDIDGARKVVPKEAPRTWKASARVEGDGFVLTVLMDRPAASAVFFPLDASQIENAAPQPAETSGRELRLRLRKSDQLTKVPAVLRGVLSFASGQSVTIAAPVTTGPATASSHPGRS